MRPRARLSEFESELCHWRAMWLWASDLSSVCLYVKWDTNSTHFTEFLMRTKRTLDSWDSSGFPWMRSSPICLWSSHQWRKAHSRDSCREDDSEAHMRAKSLHLCPTLCNPMDSSLPGSYRRIHGILQERILAWIAMLSSKGSSWPRGQTHVSKVSCISRQVFHH